MKETSAEIRLLLREKQEERRGERGRGRRRKGRRRRRGEDN